MVCARFLLRIGAALAAAGMIAVALPAAAAVPPSDALVTSGSPATPFPQNKQNEPSVALDPISGTLIAGSNDEIDLAPCHQTSTGAGSCPFTPGVGISGVYFSFDNGTTWHQPTYSGWSARTGAAQVGPIGTLPNYFEAGLVNNGDPILAVGPKPDASGHFDWNNGSRFYYSNLVENFPGKSTLPTQFVAVAVSHTDDPHAAAVGGNSNWSAPSIASGRLNPVLFDDKNSMWADNAASSPFFGRVYVSWTAFRAAGSQSTNAEPEPILLAHSDDGGATWSNPVQLSQATNNGQTGGRQGSAIRTDSHGVVYVFFGGNTPQLGSAQMMTRSFDGGRTFDKPQAVAAVNEVGAFDPFQGRFTFDGIGGARTSSFPSIDIANAAPSGVGAKNTIVLGWSDRGATPAGQLGNELSLMQTSSDGGNTWTGPVAANDPNDRPDFTAVAIAPDGSSVYVVYDAFGQNVNDYAPDPRKAPRLMTGVVRGAAGNLAGGFSTLHRGKTGDARGSSANSMVSEFIGDYNYAVASNTAVTALWNDVRAAADCPAVDQFRAVLAGEPATVSNPTGADFGEDDADAAVAATAPARPFPPRDCPANFGNSDIFGGTYHR